MGLFQKYFEATPETLKAESRELTERKIKRIMEAGHDDAEKTKIEAEEKLSKVRQNLAEYDLNSVLEAKATVKQAEETQAAIEAEYKEFFDVPLKK